MLARIFFALLLTLVIYSCTDSNYVNVKVKKSAFIADKYELDRDSLITNGIRICTSAQRYFHKSTYIGGGGYSFIGYTIPSRLRKTYYGEYSIFIKNGLIKVIGEGKNIGYDNVNHELVELIADTASIMGLSIIN